MDQWFYQTGRCPLGPIDSEELHQLAEAGIVTPETPVREGANGRWVRADEVQGLFRRSTPALGASPPEPPPVVLRSNNQVRQEAELAPVQESVSVVHSALTEFGRYILATIACGAILLLYVIACGVFEWKHGGGVIPMLMFFSAIAATWKAIIGDRRKRNEQAVASAKGDVPCEPGCQDLGADSKKPERIIWPATWAVIVCSATMLLLLLWALVFRDGSAPQQQAEPRNPFQEFTGASADARSHYLRGLAAAQNQEDFESAVQHFTEAIRIDSDYAEAYVARGCVRLYNFNEHDLAIDDHTTAVSLQPDYALAYFHRADTYWDDGRNQETLNDCDKAISLAPRFAQAFDLRARVLEELGEHERARIDRERAEQLGFCEEAPWYPWEDTSWQRWQEVTVPGVCKFTIPPTLEIQGGSFADFAGELRHSMLGPDDSITRVVIQPRGVNEFKGMGTYARVIVEVSRNPKESGLRQEELQALTPADLREIDEVLKQELTQQLESAKALGKQARLLEWNPSKIVRLDNIYVMRHGCRRQLGDNPPVQVQGYVVLLDDLQCDITVSFRESERSKWAADLEKVVSSFEFEHR